MEQDVKKHDNIQKIKLFAAMGLICEIFGHSWRMLSDDKRYCGLCEEYETRSVIWNATEKQGVKW